MRNSLLWSVLGLMLAAAATARGQGGIVINNYQAPFNRVTWDGITPIKSTDGVNLTLWFGEGVLDSYQLNDSIPMNWNTDAEAVGDYGFYNPTQAVLVGWASGQTWTFQVRASGNSIYGVYSAASVLWHENANITYIGGTPPNLPGVSTYSIGLPVPEPSLVAMLSLAFAGLAFRNSRNLN